MLSARNKIIITLSLTVALGILIKLVLPEPIKNTGLRDGFWLNKTHSKELKNIVVGGDSRIYRGVSVEAIEQETPGLTAVNLGYSSAGFSSEYLDFLTARLSSTGRKILVLGLTPHSFTLDAAKNELYHEHKEVGQFQIFKGMYLSKYLKHFAPYKPKELRDLMLHGEPEDKYFEEFRSSGWVKSYRIPEDTVKALDIYENIFSKYQVNDSLITCFFNEVDTLIANDIEVVAFRPPTFDSMSQLEDSLSGYDEEKIKYNVLMRGGVWIDLTNEDYHTYDGSHLHYTSAENLSTVIGKTIQNTGN